MRKIPLNVKRVWRATFSIAADELTVSLKLRRNVIFEKYKKELDALYADPL